MTVLIILFHVRSGINTMISLFKKMDVQETWDRSNSGIGQDLVNPAANHQPADQGRNWGLGASGKKMDFEEASDL